jgi:hypothetical protein
MPIANRKTCLNGYTEKLKFRKSDEKIKNLDLWHAKLAFGRIFVAA